MPSSLVTRIAAGSASPPAARLVTGRGLGGSGGRRGQRFARSRSRSRRSARVSDHRRRSRWVLAAGARSRGCPPSSGGRGALVARPRHACGVALRLCQPGVVGDGRRRAAGTSRRRGVRILRSRPAAWARAPRRPRVASDASGGRDGHVALDRPSALQVEEEERRDDRGDRDREDRADDALQLEADEHRHQDDHRVDAHGLAITRGWMMFMTTNQPTT